MEIKTKEVPCSKCGKIVTTHPNTPNSKVKCDDCNIRKRYAHKSPTRIIPCSICGEPIERSWKTKAKIAKCEACRKIVRTASQVKIREEGVGRWGTMAELKLIQKMSAETARKYLDGPQGLADRVNWEGINKSKCINACRKQARMGI